MHDLHHMYSCRAAWKSAPVLLKIGRGEVDGCTSTRVEEWRSKRVLSRYFDEAIRSLAFVEHGVPKIVSALEMLQSLVQIILKAVQGVSFPPNPAVIVDFLHTFWGRAGVFPRRASRHARLGRAAR